LPLASTLCEKLPTLFQTIRANTNHLSEPLQQHTGLLINEWPAIIGSDCAGVVLEVGPGCTKLKPGDHVYGCAPLGQNKFTPFQDTFLVEEEIFLKKSANLSVEETATVGAGLLVRDSLSDLPSYLLH
jgi:hypothetical protein